MLKWLGGGDARERPPRRVGVIDAVAVDRRRSVVLVRRDNIEHLVMIGGPTDVVIEPNIMRAPSRAGVARCARTDSACRRIVQQAHASQSPSAARAQRGGARCSAANGAAGRQCADADATKEATPVATDRSQSGGAKATA